MTSTKELFRPLDDVMAPDLMVHLAEPRLRGAVREPPRRRRPALAAAASLIVTALIVGGLVTAFRSLDPSNVSSAASSAMDGSALEGSAVISGATDELLAAYSAYEDADRTGDQAATEAAWAGVAATRAQLRDLLHDLGWDEPIGVGASPAQQAGALMTFRGEVALEIVGAAPQRAATVDERTELSALQSRLFEVLIQLERKLGELCAEMDNSTATAVGCGNSYGSDDAVGDEYAAQLGLIPHAYEEGMKLATSDDGVTLDGVLLEGCENRPGYGVSVAILRSGTLYCYPWTDELEGWIIGQRLQGHVPTAEEITARERELARG